MTVAGRAGVTWWPPARPLDTSAREVSMATIDASTDTDEIIEYLRHLSARPRSESRTYRTDMALDALLERGWCDA